MEGTSSNRSRIEGKQHFFYRDGIYVPLALYWRGRAVGTWVRELEGNECGKVDQEMPLPERWPG